MKKAIVFLANGFEEMEALGTVDILRRGGIEVTTVSITTDTVVMGAHNIPVTADTTLDNLCQGINSPAYDASSSPEACRGHRT